MFKQLYQLSKTGELVKMKVMLEGTLSQQHEASLENKVDSIEEMSKDVVDPIEEV